MEHIILALYFYSNLFGLDIFPCIDIFRPFVGYREVRLVNKEPKHVS